METNGYFCFVAAALIGGYLLDLLVNCLNLKSLKPELPEEFADTFDAAKYAQSQRYTRETTLFEIATSTISLAALLGFWWLGGFAWLDSFVRGFGQGPVVTGLLFFSLIFLATQVLSLPFSLYDTFVIEERHGFNKTTLATFFGDKLKGLLLAAVIGLPILAMLLAVFEDNRLGGSAWLIAWAAVTVVQLALLYLFPKFILPLFNKFTPMPEGELRSEIEALAKKCDFPLTGVYEMDGSRRSTKSNAYFTGIGKNKKIALFDTLVRNHTVRELVAVLAHEIGHFREKHILKMILISLAQMGVIFWLLGLFLKNRALFAAFGVPEVSVYGSFLFFSYVLSPVNRLLGIGASILSRKHEYEADAYAARAVGSSRDLISALKKLSKDNLVNLTPHPLAVFLEHSHPPMLERIAALRRWAPASS